MPKFKTIKSDPRCSRIKLLCKLTANNWNYLCNHISKHGFLIALISLDGCSDLNLLEQNRMPLVFILIGQGFYSASRTEASFIRYRVQIPSIENNCCTAFCLAFLNEALISEDELFYTVLHPSPPNFSKRVN